MLSFSERKHIALIFLCYLLFSVLDTFEFGIIFFFIYTTDLTMSVTVINSNRTRKTRSFFRIAAVLHGARRQSLLSYQSLFLLSKRDFNMDTGAR